MPLKTLIPLIFIIIACSGLAQAQPQKEQVRLRRVDAMAEIPKPLNIIDFRALAVSFDTTVYDASATGPYWPLIWIDETRKNYDQPVIGLYTAIGDIRQGPIKNQGMFHESLATMGAILGATLVGIDKAKDPLNYVGMLRNYFNRETGWNIMQNNTTPSAGAQGGGYARDWWYDIFPNLLFYAIYEKYPNEDGFAFIARSIADQFYKADAILEGNYDFSYFDYAKMTPRKSWICAQPDAAAGHSWVLYAAYKKFGDQRYLEGALRALRALEKNQINPSYEVLMPFGAYMAARTNAELSTSFNVTKLLSWAINPTPGCRKGWGTLVGRWNGYDISGVVGSTKEHRGHGFLMNTYDMAWPLVPMVRYDQRYANLIGKWMLNAANAAKLFYPKFLPPEHQTLPHQAGVAKGVIGYEALANYFELRGRPDLKAPIAKGDGPKWVAGNPDVTQFSVYGSAHVGIFGSIIRNTNIAGILQLDLLATDFYRDAAFPTYLFYNPYQTQQEIDVQLPGIGQIDLYDTVSGAFIARNLSGKAQVKLPPRTSKVIVMVPSKGTVSINGRKLLVNGVIVDYNLDELVFKTFNNLKTGRD